MNKKTFRLVVMVLFVSLTTICPPAFSKDTEKPSIEPGMPMPDFTLPAFQSGSVTLSDYKGKNVLLVFPRGLSGKARFCAIDNYRYAELMELEKAERIREKYNVEILYVFPYSKKTVKDWVMKNPDQLKNIEKWK
ncbi:MAG: redoxin domain-containing protein, partial [Alphaproteobacteria bacterium]